MSPNSSLSASLQIPSDAAASGKLFLRGIADVLSTHDGGSTEVRISAKHCAVAAANFIAKVETDNCAEAGRKINFRLAGRPGRPTLGQENAVAILSDIVMRALPLVDADHVVWLRPGVLLTPEEFLAAQSYISPKRARRHAGMLPDTEGSVDSIDRNVAHLLRTETSLFEAFAAPAPIAPTARASCESAPVQRPEPCVRGERWSLASMAPKIPLPVSRLVSALHSFRGGATRLLVLGLLLTGTAGAMLDVDLAQPLSHLAGS